jgi:hypothetical protein
MVDAIRQLREIARRCASGQPLHEDLSRWLADSLERFLAHQAASIEEAFGMQPMRGGIPWWREEAIRQRDALLRLLALRHFPSMSLTQKSREICRLARRYAATAWRFDRDLAAMPDRYRDKPQELLFRAFRLPAPMPVCERHLRTILAGLEQAKDVVKDVEEALRQCGLLVSEAIKNIDGDGDGGLPAQG